MDVKDIDKKYSIATFNCNRVKDNLLLSHQCITNLIVCSKAQNHYEQPFKTNGQK
jgi:hypothetical protein